MTAIDLPSSHRSPRPAGPLRRTAVAAVAALTPVCVLSACGGAADTGSARPAAVDASGPSVSRLSVDTVRIGYYDNLTHGTALVGLKEGLFQKELGATGIRTQIFNAGPAEIDALNAGTIDIGWIGPSPAIDGYLKSGGQSLRIISGSASGGVRLVVNPRRIHSVADLRGKRIATPQLGNTQDVALLNFLADKGYKVDAQSGTGDVNVVRIDNRSTPDAYKSGAIDGAWVPEPTASRLVGLGAAVLLNETSVWPAGRFVITNVIVSQKFLREHPDVVAAVLRGSVRTNAFIKADPDRAAADANDRIRADGGTALEPSVLAPAWSSIEFLDDPLAVTLQAEADHAVTADLLKKPDLTGIYDLAPLNRVLTEQNRPTVTDAQLGVG